MILPDRASDNSESNDCTWSDGVTATDYAESQKVGAHKQALGDTHLYSKQY